MTPWTARTAPFITELAGLAAGAMGGAGGPGASAPPPANAASQTVSNKAKGSKANVNVVFGNEGDTTSDGAASAPSGAGGLDLSPALILAVMVFVLILVAVVALLGR